MVGRVRDHDAERLERHLKSAYLEIVGGSTVALSSSWGKWQGKPGADAFHRRVASEFTAEAKSKLAW